MQLPILRHLLSRFRQKNKGAFAPLFFLLVARIRPSSATLRVAELGSHFASKAMGARSREPRAKIFAQRANTLVLAKRRRIRFAFAAGGGRGAPWCSRYLKSDIFSGGAICFASLNVKFASQTLPPPLPSGKSIRITERSEVTLVPIKKTSMCLFSHKGLYLFSVLPSK